MLAFSITISVLLVAAIIVAIIYFNSPKSKGKRGERKVARKLGKNIPDEKYVINDLFIQTENGSPHFNKQSGSLGNRNKKLRRCHIRQFITAILDAGFSLQKR